MAGIDLPTRSVHALGSVSPRPEPRARRPRRRRNGAVALLTYTGLLALLTAGAWMVTVVAHTDRFLSRLAPITLDRMDTAVILLGGLTLAAAALTLLAAATHAIRRP